MGTERENTIKALLGKDGVEVIYLEETGSTNLDAIAYARAHSPDAPTVFIAERQTAGRGRLGRSFVSRSGGIYMSILTRADVDAEFTSVTVYAATVVARAIEKLTELSPRIKWVNDIYLSGRKVSGILTQGVVDAESGKITHIVMGVGINVTGKELPDEIKDIATTLELEGAAVGRDALSAEVARLYLEGLDTLGTPEVAQEYKRRSFLIGERVNVISPDKTYPATVIDIDEKSRLIVRTDNGDIIALSSGDVSVRCQ